MADPEMEEDLFADLYDGEDQDPEPTMRSEPEPVMKAEPSSDSAKQDSATGATGGNDFNIKTDEDIKPFDPAAEDTQTVTGGDAFQNGGWGAGAPSHAQDNERQVRLKEDGKMFIGGLNWETTDQSLKDYFSQFGEVLECTVMRDGATGRSRGFGFLTFKDPKTVNIVTVKEHMLDGKLIDPKRAIPRDEQEKTAKIFVGGVSQEATESDFKDFFDQFGHVLDATLMMDKDTGRPRGFGFVTFDSELAVDRTLEQPLAIHGKMIEVKRAQPRGNMRDDDDGGRGGKFGRHGKGNQFNNNNNNNNNNTNDFGGQQNQVVQNGQEGGMSNMSPAMLAQYWQRMHQYFQMMQQQLATNMGGGMNPMAAMQGNPAMMQQMMAMGRGQGMNPQMLQQMAAMQGYPGMGGQSPGSPMNNGAGTPGAPRPGFNAQEQLMFEQQKYERQSMARMQQPNMHQGGTWDGMYDDVPAPAGMQGGNNPHGNFGGRGGRGGGHGSQGPTPVQAPAQAPVNAPTGPKNAGKPGANYRGGGRGAHRGFHPYARGGG